MHTSTRRQLVQRLFGTASKRAATTSPILTPRDEAWGQQLLARATFGANREVVGDLENLGAERWLEQQLHPDTLDDSIAEEIVAGVIAPWERGAADIRLLARALYSRRQLAWRMVHFLNNHFATYRFRTTAISETKEDDLFYGVCFGKFSKVLRMSAASPAMIDFLDSGSNIAGNPNENYARELLELHTVSVDGGYTETDVAELARVFTGWARVNVGGGVVGNPYTDSYFEFRPTLHDPGPKTLSLGWSTPGISGPSGRLEGWDVLGFLASESRTAAFFSLKLCRYFVSDTPSVSLVSRVRQAFLGSDGDLRITMRALFLDPEFATASNVSTKTHDGFEHIVNVLRRFKGPINLASVNARIGQLRSRPHDFHIPTGYPEIGTAWQGPGHLLPRWDFADDYANDRISGVKVPWERIFGVIPSTGAAWVSGLLDFLVDQPLPETTVWALTLFMNNRLAPVPNHPSWSQVLPHARALLALILQLPEVQMH